MLNPNSALWDEGRAILEQELREPKVYFGILQALADGDKDVGEVASALRSDAQRVSKYLKVLQDMRLVERRLPAGAEVSSRMGHWHLRDPFFRFWFRFIFPFQDDLESGLSSETLFDTEVAPVLNEHVGVEFEEYCRRWTRANRQVTRVASWWGPALHALRKTGERSTEEIDVVGMARGRVVVVGEATWRNTTMDVGYLAEIEDGLRAAVEQRTDVTLVDVANMLAK